MKRRHLPLWIAIALWANPALAAVPGQLHYQGYLTDAQGAPVHCPDAENCEEVFNVTFRAYDAPEGGDALWEETHAGVGVSHGLFNVRLGSQTPLDPAVLGDPTWLGLEINEAGELLPRQRIVSAAFSLRAGQAEAADTAALAEDANRLGGLDATDYALVADLPGLCVTDADLATLSYLDAAGVGAQIETYLTDNGYVSGAHFSGSFEDLSDVPPDLADGDQDTLASMSCEAGALPRYDGAVWTCSEDQTLTEDEVDAMVADNGYALAEDVQADLAGLASVAVTGDFTDLSGVPEALADGDDDALAALDCGDGQVPKMTEAGWLCAPDAVLTPDEVDAIVADNGYASQADLTAVADAALTAGEVDAIVADNGYASDDDLQSLAQSLSPVATGGTFEDLAEVPEGLADGDDDALAALVCDDGEITKRVDGAWTCAPAVTGKLPTSPPVDCSPDVIGTMYFDLSLGSLRICDGTAYRKIKFCSEQCPLAATVACGVEILDDCDENCGQSGTGLNTAQCPGAEQVPCGATSQDDCGNECPDTGTGPSQESCPATNTVACGEPVLDECGNPCGLTGTGCSDNGTCLPSGCQLPASCAAILAVNPNSPSGNYLIDLDGPGAQQPLEASCDMTTDGGGWTLVLSYLHQSGSNPDLVIRTANLPLLGNDILGASEAGTSHWGHASSSLLSGASIDEVMFYCRSSGHSRVIHFKTNSDNVISYIQTGSGTMSGVYSSAASSDLALYANATLPLHTSGENSAYSNQGDFAMTEFPFFSDSGIGNPRAHWGIRGGGNRWECDDYSNGDQLDTLHRIWFR